jgi:hypothetical protein
LTAKTVIGKVRTRGALARLKENEFRYPRCRRKLMGWTLFIRFVIWLTGAGTGFW